MRVHYAGHVLEVTTPEDVALLVACLLPTQAEIDAAKRAMYAERAATGLEIDDDGRLVVAA
jgi:hypothetical protein